MCQKESDERVLLQHVVLLLIRIRERAIWLQIKTLLYTVCTHCYVYLILHVSEIQHIRFDSNIITVIFIFSHSSLNKSNHNNNYNINSRLKFVNR
jgi:hypothetical protein